MVALLPFLTARKLIAAMLITWAPGAHAMAPQEGASGADMEAVMRAMQLAQPGPEHAELAKLAGEWTMTITMQMAPGMPAQTQTVDASSRMILDDRFLEVTSTGELMGMPVETLTFLGFDRRLKQYTLLGMDTLGTYWVTAAGAMEENGMLRLQGEDDSPDGKQIYTFEFEFINDDTFEQRTLFKQIGHLTFDEPFLMVKVRYQRKDVTSPEPKSTGKVFTVPGPADLTRGEILTASILDASCGQCQFDLPGDGCDLAVRVGDTAWFATGTNIDEHGDAHATDGFCNAIRQARVSGHVEEGKFIVTQFALLPDVEG